MNFIKKTSVIILSIVLFFCSVQGMKHKSSRLFFKEEDLKKIAESDGYGYKYGNLKILKQLSKQFNQTTIQKNGYSVQVPDFKGISSENIQRLLYIKGNFNAIQEWQKIVAESLLNLKQIILQNKKFPEGFEKERKLYKNNLKQAFDKIVESSRIISFDELFNTHDQKIDQFIKENEHSKLMVRSTGKEDTRALANAGGNASKANVSPHSVSIVEAIKDVVVSYFSKKSLTQRLGAGDESLFELTPFTPVLIQLMISEKNNQIPKCGVMFTEEVEGGISKTEQKDKNGKIITTGISIIQCAYGHNEGVVNSLIPVDTFYVDAMENIYSVVRKKTHRLVPSEERELKTIQNPSTIIDISSLKKDAVLVFKAFSNTLENYYGYPVDVEFVIDEEEKKIYIVQARPITHNKKIVQPSYLANVEDIKLDKVVGGVIGVAGGALRYIDGPDNIIIQEDIGKALAVYQNETSNLDDIRVIIVGKMAPTTSHEATTFRGANKPVLYIPEWEKIVEWIKEKNKLVVSPQQGLVIKCAKEFVKKYKGDGWINYPISPYISVNDEFAPMKKMTKIGIDNVKILIRTAAVLVGKESFEKAWKKIELEITNKDGLDVIKYFFKTIKFGEHASSAVALVMLIKKCGLWIENQTKKFKLDDSSTHYLKLLASHAMGYAYKILKVLHYQPKDFEFTKRLFPICFLESLFWQTLQPDIIDNVSIASFVLNWLGSEKKIAQQYPSFGFVTRKLAFAKDLAMTPELGQKWTSFLDAMKKSDKSLQNDFGNLFFKISELGALPLWLHTSFAFKYPEKMTQEEAQKIITNCVNEYRENNNKNNLFLDKLMEKKQLIDGFNIGNFDKSKNFIKVWSSFKTDLIDYFVSKDFTGKLTNNFAKLMSIGIMNSFVDLFDRSIKTVEVTANVEHVYTMLLSYRELFYTWIELVQIGTIKYHDQSGLNNYKGFIDKILNEKIINDKKMLQARSNFNVAGVTIGNITNLDTRFQRVIPPSTYEEVFMMIHQCLLVTLSGIGKDAKLDDIHLPKVLKALDDECRNLRTENKKQPSRIGVRMSSMEFSLLYNLALRNHSMQYQLSYDNILKIVSAKFDFIGRFDFRWENIYDYILFLKISKNLTVISLQKTSNSVSFELSFKDKKSVYGLSKYIQKCVDRTYADNENIVVDIDEKSALTVIDYLQMNDNIQYWTSVFRFILPWLNKIKNSEDKNIDLVNKISLKAMQMVSTHLDNEDFKNVEIYEPGLIFLKLLVEKGFEDAYQKACQIATKIVKEEKSSVYEKGLDLFELLVKKGYKKAYFEAIRHAVKVIDAENENSSWGVLLFIEVVKKGYEEFYNQAIEVAAKVMQKNNLVVQGLYLFKALFKKGQGKQKAIEVIEILIKKKNPVAKKLQRYLEQSEDGDEDDESEDN